MMGRRVWYRAGYANERDGCNLIAKVTGGLVVTTVAFGRANQRDGILYDDDGAVLLPVAYTGIARPSLCGARSTRRSGYHWGSVEQRRVEWPFSMAGLGELHESTVARVVGGDVSVPLVCAQCRARALEGLRACALEDMAGLEEEG